MPSCFFLDEGSALTLSLTVGDIYRKLYGAVISRGLLTSPLKHLSSSNLQRLALSFKTAGTTYQTDCDAGGEDALGS